MINHYSLPDGSKTSDPEFLAKEWKKCQKFMQRIFPNHVIVSMNPGFKMVEYGRDRYGDSFWKNIIEISTETYICLVKNKNKIASRLLEPID